MNDDMVLDSYVRSLINIDMNEDEFLQYMNLFSKYLGYTNPSYKYNGTYLNQYTKEFIKSCAELKHKNKIYNQIFFMLVNTIKIPFELTIDNSYYVYFDKLENLQNNKIIYKRYDVQKINSDNFGIKLKINYGKECHIFLKEFTSENIGSIVDEVAHFLQLNGLGKEKK